MKVEIEGELYHAVPSIDCHSVVGGLRCSQFHTSLACEPLQCSVAKHRVNGAAGICFLDDKDFTKWLAARLTA